MIPQTIPFENIGIEQEDGERVVRAINDFIAEHPNESIDIQTISQASRVLGVIVKRVFYALLSLRWLKATFIPRHRVCGSVVDKQAQSVHAILQKADNGDLHCVHCIEQVEGSQDIEINLIFWGLGTDVK